MNPFSRRMLIFCTRLTQSGLRVSVAVLVICFCLASPLSLRAQQDSSLRRKLINHPAAAYPSLARNMALAGVVKVDALVSADGTVKSLDVKGGHPVLAQAAANTIRQWKWEPAAHESHEMVEIRFSPPE
jgi:TonB family protein